MHVLCNFFFCHYVFKKPSAAEASESVYMRERVKHRLDFIYEKCFKHEQMDRQRDDWKMICEHFPTWWLIGSRRNRNVESMVNLCKRKFKHWIELKTLWKKGEIAHHVQLLLLPKCIANIVCCKRIRKSLYVGKG